MSDVSIQNTAREDLVKERNDGYKYVSFYKSEYNDYDFYVSSTNEWNDNNRDSIIYAGGLTTSEEKAIAQELIDKQIVLEIDEKGVCYDKTGIYVYDATLDRSVGILTKGDIPDTDLYQKMVEMENRIMTAIGNGGGGGGTGVNPATLKEALVKLSEENSKYNPLKSFWQELDLTV